MDNKVKPKLKKNGTPYKIQPKIPNVITSEKKNMVDKLDDKTHVKTFTTDAIIVSFNSFN